MLTIAEREFRAYFTSPIAYILLIVFPAAAGALPFFVDDFFGREQADLSSFFRFHPWLYLVLMPALAMRLWSEEQRDGTFELLVTLPLSTTSAVFGKFVAAWAFTAIALALTTPMWLSVNYLGEPDNRVIALGYLASWLLSGVFLAIGAACSALSSNQIVAFTLGIVVGFLFIGPALVPLDGAANLASLPWPKALLSSFDLIAAFTVLAEGLIAVSSLTLMVSLLLVALAINIWLVELKKAA